MEIMMPADPGNVAPTKMEKQHTTGQSYESIYRKLL